MSSQFTAIYEKGDMYVNPINGVIETVPRHIEIDNRLAKKICNRFGIPEP